MAKANAPAEAPKKERAARGSNPEGITVNFLCPHPVKGGLTMLGASMGNAKIADVLSRLIADECKRRKLPVDGLEAFQTK